MSNPALRLTRQATYPLIASRGSGSPDLYSPFPAFDDEDRSVAQTSRQQRMSWTASWGAQRPRNPWDDVMDTGNVGSQDRALYSSGAAELALPLGFPSLTFAPPTSYERMSAALEDDGGTEYSGVHGTGSEWSYSDGEDDIMEDVYHPGVADEDDMDLAQYGSPLVDDMSPIDNAEPGSSPGPVTPFGDYVDRAIVYPAKNTVHHSELPLYDGQSQDCGSHCPQCQQHQHVATQAEKPAPIATPSATEAYRNTADHLSVWIAEYVWKLCISMPDFSGLSLAHSSTPPASLATSVRSLLLSTILQPSAVCLALQYISRLPVFLGPMYLPFDCEAEAQFRAALLGRPEAYDREDMENQAPFRLIVLGFMFANKWLDDHTFSNKTWHSISGIPIRWLNNLEYSALSVLKHDLTISVQEWTEWLSHLSSYHASLAPSPRHYPQPIARPTSSSHEVIRTMLEDLTATSRKVGMKGQHRGHSPEPVFTGLEQRQQEKATQYAVQDIDLDEGGPLREEYLPKRRSSTSAARDYRSSQQVTLPRPSSLVSVDRHLPPPKWSPELDEPVRRNVDASSRSLAPPRTFYEAPPPPVAPIFHVQAPPSAPQQWSVSGGYSFQPQYAYADPGYAAHKGGPGSSYGVPVFSSQESSWPAASYAPYAPLDLPRLGYAPSFRSRA